jgi:hypothetical protein
LINQRRQFDPPNNRIVGYREQRQEFQCAALLRGRRPRTDIALVDNAVFQRDISAKLLVVAEWHVLLPLIQQRKFSAASMLRSK